MTDRLLTALAALALATAGSAQAQTNTIPSFFQSAESYFTSFNTNYCWTNVTLEAATGYKQVTGVGAASTLDLQWDIGRFDVGGAFQFSGVGSAFNAEELQVGYALLEHYDTKLEAGLRAGYDSTYRRAVIEPGVFAKKKLTYNTYAEIGITMPEYPGRKANQTPTFVTEVGFTF